MSHSEEDSTDIGSVLADDDHAVADTVSVFETTSDVTYTREERLRVLFDEIVVAPAKILWNDYRARFGSIILAFYLFMGLVGVHLVDVPFAGQGPMLQQPFEGKFLLGTDQTGKSIAAGIVHSTPPILKMMASGAVFSTVMAVMWGVVAGYKGGYYDRVMMTIADVVMNIPGLPLIVVLATIWKPGNPYLVGILLSITGWAGLSRALRSQVLTLREESYVEASRILGMRNRSIMFIDILPNLMPYIMVNFVKSARSVIFSAVGLYFLGILPFTSINWGVMMNLSYKGGALFDPNLTHWFVVPTVTVVILSLGLILFGQGMDRLFNPRIRARHAKHTPNDEENI
ncbi:ABC transporter permease [Haloarchaeobius sp. TZWSO28]|uniref:ABC transporter permease n=1 Tax=Haloarchaeobius sp. TZWSO28 TaxID=3446119 RepID=UPI003EC04C4C